MSEQQNTSRSFQLIAAMVLLICITSASNSFALLIAGDSFDYAIGTELSSGTLNGGIGWDGAWQGGGNIGTSDQIEAANIVAPTGYVGAAGNQLLLNTDSPSFNLEVNARRDLAQGIDFNPSVAQTYYYSVLLRRDDGFNGGGGENARYLELWETGGSVPMLAAGTTSDEATSVAFNGWGGNGVGTLGEVPLGTDLLAVVKFVLRPSGQNDELYMTFLQDGADLSGEPVSWMASTTYDMSGVASYLRIVNTRYTDQQRYDEVRLGTTFADVVAGQLTHPGDANGDGMVNLADLQILGDNWQSTTAAWAEADFTGDGVVNLSDLQIIGDNWGYGVSSDVSWDEALAQTAIPEPAALTLMGLALPLVLRRRHTN